MNSFRSFAAVSVVLAAAAYAQDCVLTVPANPTSAAGLATPYFVTGCDQTQLETASFVECAIYDNAGAITMYHPLVVNQGAVAGVNFVAPVAATVPAGATVGCWFGTNGMTLTLTGPGAKQCVNGLGNSIFGQFAHCNGDVFMKKAEADAAAGVLKVPPPGQGAGGQCPTTRDFRIVDQDQSDNVVSSYLLVAKNGTNVLMQNTPANAKNVGAMELDNGSDNGLVDNFLAPALGCQVWKVQSPTTPSGSSAGLALNELVANFNPPAVAVPALVPLNDPMVLVNGNPSLEKTNLYRAAVGQPQANTAADADPTKYCSNFLNAGIFIAQDMGLFQTHNSPMPAVANNLYTFLAQRFAASLSDGNLGCLNLLKLAQPVTMATDGNGVVTSATINTSTLLKLLGTASTAAAGASTSAAAAGASTSAAAAGGSTSAAAAGASTSAAATGASSSAAAAGASTSATSAASSTAATTKATTKTARTRTASTAKTATSQAATSNTAQTAKTAATQSTSATMVAPGTATTMATVVSSAAAKQVSSAANQASSAATQATSAATQATSAGTQASSAATQASSAATQASSASTQATAASTQATAASSAAGQVTSMPAAAATSSTTTVVTVPSSTVTLTSAASALSTTITCTINEITFHRDPRGAVWDGEVWYVRADYVGFEWVNWAGPAPTGNFW